MPGEILARNTVPDLGQPLGAAGHSGQSGRLTGPSETTGRPFFRPFSENGSEATFPSFLRPRITFGSATFSNRANHRSYGNPQNPQNSSARACSFFPNDLNDSQFRGKIQAVSQRVPDRRPARRAIIGSVDKRLSESHVPIVVGPEMRREAHLRRYGHRRQGLLLRLRRIEAALFRRPR